MRRRVILSILVTGLSGIIAEVLLLRELLITFYGNELSIGIILANWLILEAIGAFFLGRRIERLSWKIEAFVLLTIIFSLSFPAAIYIARTIKGIIGVIPGEGLGLVPIMSLSFLILSAVSISHGALFTFGCKIYSLYPTPKGVSEKGGHAASIGKVYIYETLGTTAGGIGLTFLLIPYFNSLEISFAVSLLNVLLCVYLLMPLWRKAPIFAARALTVASVIFLFLISFMLLSGQVEKIHRLSIKNQWKGQKVIYYRNSIYGNVAVTQRGEQYTFFADGVPIINIPVPDITFVEEFVHIPMLSHPDPRNILVISGGVGGVINEILKYPSVKRVDYAELDPLILETVERYTTPSTKAELSDPRVNVERIDGRFFVKTTPDKYDLVLVGLSNPSDLQVNRFFTREFFVLAKNKLNKEGMLVINLPGSLTYLDKELRDLNACIINTLKAAYPYVRIIPGDNNLFLASASPEAISVTYLILADRFKERNLKVSLITPAYIEYKLSPDWLNWFMKSLEGATRKINLDFLPIGVFYSVSFWNAVFAPYMQKAFRVFEAVSLWPVFISLSFFTVIFLSLIRKTSRLARFSIPLCVTTTGFAGMIFNLALIFAFQVLYGYVFLWIGFLITILMFGISIGGWVMTLFLGRIKRAAIPFIETELSITLFSAALPSVFYLLRPYLDHPAALLPQIIFLALSFFSGFLIGLQFPLANKMYLDLDMRPKGPDLGGTAGLLYGSDLVGGWIGGIVGGIILLPVLGLAGACLVAAMFKVCSVIIFAKSIYG
ncbi:MAG: hypothetical protein A2Z72_02360 [Omnitrophica bacterium RBG_13_46_9]|nr:MAG: hypothetical protein A2Z72_02360 [Omnitrophica bacterium RBG_13_46_9]